MNKYRYIHHHTHTKQIEHFIDFFVYLFYIFKFVMIRILKKILFFYIEGFKSMTVGKKLWAIIIIKLFIMFAILKVFFFKDFLNTRFKSNEEKANYVLEQLSK